MTTMSEISTTNKELVNKQEISSLLQLINHNQNILTVLLHNRMNDISYINSRGQRIEILMFIINYRARIFRRKFPFGNYKPSVPTIIE